MSGALQAVFQNQRSFVEPPPTVIGQAYGGGYYAGQISTTANSVATHYLVVGPVSSAQSGGILEYKTTNTTTAGTSSDIDGPTNSSNMNNVSHPAAKFCEDVTSGGQSDWYLPAKNELDVCYFNLKPTSGINNLFSGINPNAVPARASNYTLYSPAQTSASVFVQGGAESFSDTTYTWSSTEASDPTKAKRQAFVSGIQDTIGKYYQYKARAVRRVPI